MALEKIKETLEKREIVRGEVDQRRIELMQQRALGVDLNILVQTLSVKYNRSAKTVYNDWRTRRKWAPKLLGLEDGESIIVDIVTLLNWLKRRGVMEVLQGDSSSNRIGAIKAVKDIVMNLYDIVSSTGLVKLSPRKVDVKISHDITSLLSEYESIFEPKTVETQPLQENNS